MKDKIVYEKNQDSFTFIPDHTTDKNGNPKPKKGTCYFWRNAVLFCRFGSFKMALFDDYIADLVKNGYTLRTTGGD